MDRRDFLRRGLGKVSEAAVEHADKKLAAKVNWIRPPFALHELEFLLACTRCDACVTACPHEVIFKLAPRLGPEVVGTPALDLLNRACHLCEDWPCVTNCEAQALKLPEAELHPPKLARAIINQQSCLPWLGPECGACRASCPVDQALIWDGERPLIQLEYCTGCALCRESCVTEPKAIDIQLLSHNTQ